MSEMNMNNKKKLTYEGRKNIRNIIIMLQSEKLDPTMMWQLWLQTSLGVCPYTCHDVKAPTRVSMPPCKWLFLMLYIAYDMLI